MRHSEIQQHTEFGKYLWDNTLMPEGSRQRVDRIYYVTLPNLLKKGKAVGEQRRIPVGTCKYWSKCLVHSRSQWLIWYVKFLNEVMEWRSCIYGRFKFQQKSNCEAEKIGELPKSWNQLEIDVSIFQIYPFFRPTSNDISSIRFLMLPFG